MKKRHYKTLRGLFRANDIRQFSLSDYLSRGVYCYKTNVWIHFTISEEVAEEICGLFANGFCETKAAKEKYARLIPRVAKNCRIFRNLIIEKGSNGKFRPHYCAGQDYPAEVRYVQHLIRKYS